MKKNRIISAMLSFLMVLSLFAAYPAVEKVTVVTAAGTNVAPLAQYYGTGGTNGTGNYGEENWSTYHTGKLNDGTIPTDYAENTKGLNVELASPDITNASANVWIYVYFKLDKTYTVSSVNVYMNFRNTTTANRAYPDQVTIGVGASETSTTSLGTVSSSSYNTSVMKFTASGSASGDYVVLGLHVPSGSSVICCSEVEIYGAVSASGSNVATSATYKGTAGQNGTGQYSDNGITDAQWQSYHTGRLNDGVIASDYCNVDTNKSVDVLTANETLYFQLDKTYVITEVRVYTVDRSNVQTRAHPQSVTVSVGTSETSTTALTSGAMPDTTVAVAMYSSTGSIKGNYVVVQAKAGIHEGGTQAGSIVFTEVEIYGYVDTSALQEPSLSVSNMSNSTKNRSGRYATYTVPTISWSAVANASSYDVYFNGTKVVSDTTSTSYTPSSLTPFDQYGKGDNRTSEKIYVVAKGSGYADGVSETLEFLYVPKPTDRNGNEVVAADFIIDAGHGGTDSGAVLDTRYEKNDNLNLAMKVGALLEAAGFSVAYTRTMDVFHSVATKAAKAHAGNFRAFLSFHRNSAAGAVGVEMYAHTADAASTALKWSMTDELDVDGLWRMRELPNNEKTNNSLGILAGNSVVPTTLLEIGFISTESDNVLFDTYFNETAQAIARGAMKYLGYSTSYTGFVDSPSSVNFAGAAVTVNATAGNYGSTASVGIGGWVVNGYGVSKVQYSTDGSTWYDANSYDRSGELGAYASYANKANAGYSASISTVGWTPGTYTVQLRAVSNWETTTKYDQLLPIANINVTVSDTVPSYTVRFLVDGVAVSTQTIKAGGSAVAPDAPTKEGHNFLNWDNAYTNIQADTDINAVFEKKSYTVNFYADGVLISEQTVKYEEAAVAPESIPAKPGYLANGWDNSFESIVDNIDVNVVYEYDASQWFTVTYNVPDTVNTTGEISFGPFVVGTAWADADIAEPTVSSNGYYVFKGWDAIAPETITENLVFNAIVALEGVASVGFACDVGGVIYHIENGATIVGDYTIAVNAGTLVSDIEMPVVLCNTDYTFSGWYVDGVALEDTAVVDRDMTLVARFNSSAVTFGDYSVENTENGSTTTVTITVNSSISLDNCYMYVFNQHVNGTTTVSISGITLVETETEGVYTISVATLGNTVSGLDVFFTDSVIDFSDNWTAIASVIGINVLP